MNKSVERSIALWKAQNGPIRKQVGRHITAGFLAMNAAPAHPFFIDYTQRRCDYR